MKRRLFLVGLFASLCRIALAQFSEAELHRVFEADLREVPDRYVATPIDIASSALSGAPDHHKRVQHLEARFKRLGCVHVRRQPFMVTRPSVQPIRAKVAFEGAAWVDERVWPLWPNLVDVSNMAPLASNAVDKDGTVDCRVIKNVTRDEAEQFVNDLSKLWILEPNHPVERFGLEPFMIDVPVRSRIVWSSNGLPHGERASARRTKVIGRLRWETVETYNLLAEIPGTDPKLAQEPIILGTYADGFSVVPGLAPSGTASANVDALCAIVEQLVARPAPRPVQIVVFSGHAQGLKGERVFVRSLLAKPTQAIRGAYFLDLSGNASTVGVFSQGGLFATRPESRDIVRRPAAVFRMFGDDLTKQRNDPKLSRAVYDGVNESDGQPWRATHLGPFACSSEPFLLANLPGFTFRTIHDARPKVGTPADVLTPAEHKAIAKQAGIICALLRLPLHQPSQDAFDGVPPFPLEPTHPRQATLVAAFAELKGKAQRFDPAKSFLPNVPVADALAVVQTEHKLLCGVLGDMVESTDAEGFFSFDGLPGVQSYWHSERQPTKVSAFVLAENGEVAAVATASQQTGPPFPRVIFLDAPVRSTTLTMFDAKVGVALNALDPLDGTPLTNVRLLDRASESEPRYFEVFSPPNQRTKSGASSNHIVVFHDAPNPVHVEMRGAGPELKKVWRGVDGSYTVLSEQGAATSSLDELTALHKRFAPYRMLPPEAHQLLSFAHAQLQIEPSQAMHSGPTPETQALQAQAVLAKLRPLLSGQAREMVLGLLMYLALLIPFAWAAERVVFGHRFTYQRLLTVCGFFASGYLLLQATHPAFQVVKSPFIIFIAFAMAALSLWVIALILQRFDQSLRPRNQFDSHGRGGWTLAFGLATGNLRRRPLRTALMVGQLTVAGFVIMSFSSLGPRLVTQKQLIEPSPGLSQGEWVRTQTGEPLPRNVSSNMRAGLDTLDVIYPDPQRKLGKFEVIDAETVHEARALVLWPRWADVPASRSSAQIWVPKSWGITSKTVAIHGVAFTVMGTIEAEGSARLATRPSPFDFGPGASSSQNSESGFRAVAKMPQDQFAVVRFEQGRAWPGHTLYAQLASQSENNSEHTLERSLLTNLPLLSASNEQVHLMSSAFGVQPEGLGFAILPFILTIIFVWTTANAAAYERRAEMATFAALGMAPRHMVSLFIAEATLVGILGTMLAYVLAQTVSRVALQTPAMQGLILNFGSLNSAVSAFATLLIAILGSLYPTWLAVRQSQSNMESASFQTPDDQSFVVRFPVAIEEHESIALIEFLVARWRDALASGAGALQIDNVVSAADAIDARMAVAPYDLGVFYSARFSLQLDGASPIVRPELALKVQSGDLANAKRLVSRVVEAIRQDMLAYRLSQSA